MSAPGRSEALMPQREARRPASMSAPMPWLEMPCKDGERPMCCPANLSSIATLAWAALAAPICVGQTPVPARSISMPWLGGVRVVKIAGGTAGNYDSCSRTC
jgi:hypothetical protein